MGDVQVSSVTPSTHIEKVTGEKVVEVIHSERGSSPTTLQTAAINYWLEHGGTKGNAMRAVGYSESMCINPQKVFGTVGAKEILEYMGADEQAAIAAVKRNLTAKKSMHLTFPSYNPEKALEHEEIMNRTGEDLTEQIRSEQMTDAQIREYLVEMNCQVFRIVHGDQARHVYCYAPDGEIQLMAASKVFEIAGSYAPKKSEVKAQLGIFSLADLRKNMKDNGFDVIEQAAKADEKLYGE